MLRATVAGMGTLCLLSELQVAAARAWTLVPPLAVLGVVTPSEGKRRGVEEWREALEKEERGVQ